MTDAWWTEQHGLWNGRFDLDVVMQRLRPGTDIGAIVRPLHRRLALRRAEGLGEFIAAPFAERVGPRHGEVAWVGIVVRAHFSPCSVGLWHFATFLLEIVV